MISKRVNKRAVNVISDEWVKREPLNKNKQCAQIDEMKKQLDEEIRKPREMKDKKVGTDYMEMGIYRQ